MGLFRPSRENERPERLALRMALLMAAAVAGLIGMATGNRIVIGVGVVAAVVGIFVRFIPSRRSS